MMRFDPFGPAVSMLDALQSRQISAEELLDEHLRRIARHNPELNAIVVTNEREARATAREADRMRAGSNIEDSSPRLLGLPITIKDCIYVQGLPTTGGVAARAGTVEPQDAPLISSLRSAGAVIMGKTNVPPYASDWQSNNPVFGRSNNPWDTALTPGGSTGGGAAAVAAGLTPLEWGGDFAGSIRVPACFCGTYGHKPSLTALPRTGHFPGNLFPNAAEPLAVLGPLARSAEDLELAIDVTAGPGLGEDVAWRITIPPSRQENMSNFRVAVLPLVSWMPVDNDIGASLERVADALRGAGATVEIAQPHSLGDLREYYSLYIRIMAAIESTRLQGERRSNTVERLRTSGDWFLEQYADGIEGTASDFVVWHALRERHRESFRRFFGEWDILLAPAAPVNAFPHDDRRFSERRLMVNGKPVYYGFMSFFAGLASLSGHPATAFPAGFTSTGLPVGLQAIGPYLEDRTCVRFAGLMSREIGGFIPPPAYISS